MARDRVFEGRAEVRSLAVVAREARVRLGDVRAETGLRRRPLILRWHAEGLERGLRSLAAANGQLEELELAAVGGELQIAFGAVDLREQVGAARDPAAVMDREGSPALEQSADGHLIIRRHRLAFADPSDREGLPAHRHGGRELSDLAEAVTKRVRRVAERDRQYRRAVLPVVEVDIERLDRRSPAHARTDERRREHLTDVALLDEVPYVRHGRRGARLETND